WVLILDADERVPEELSREIDEVLSSVPPTVAAFRLKRRFHFWGRWLRHSSLYPTWIVRLVHKKRVRYVNRGHSETQIVDGGIRVLHNDLIDENLKGIDEWFTRQNRYSRHEADYELVAQHASVLGEFLGSNPPIRRAALKRLSWRIPARGI